LETWNNRIASAQNEKPGFEPLSNSSSNLVAVFNFHGFWLLVSFGAFLVEKRDSFQQVLKQISSLVSDIIGVPFRMILGSVGKKKVTLSEIRVLSIIEGQVPCQQDARIVETEGAKFSLNTLPLDSITLPGSLRSQ